MTIMRTVTHTCAQRFTGYKVFHIHHLINSSQQPCEVGRAGSSVSIYTDVEAEAQAAEGRAGWTFNCDAGAVVEGLFSHLTT